MFCNQIRTLGHIRTNGHGEIRVLTFWNLNKLGLLESGADARALKIQLFDVFTKFRNNAPLFISVSIHSTSNFVEKQREKVIILKCISALYKLNCHLILDITRKSCGN